IAGQHFLVSQAAGCSVTLNVYTDTKDASGVGPGNIDVTGANPSCGWEVESDVWWIVVTPEFNHGVGNGHARYDVMWNSTGDQRIGHVIIGDKQITVTQRGTIDDPHVSCVTSVATTLMQFSDSNDTSSLHVDAPSNCNWEAVVVNEDFVHITENANAT